MGKGKKISFTLGSLIKLSQKFRGISKNVLDARVKFGDTLRSTLEGNTFNDFNYL